jgi:hypothetical protein
MMSQIDVKYFTPKEAQRTMPLVKQIVKDILNYAFMVKTIAESMDEGIEENRTINMLMKKMESFINELEEIGCSYKDWNFKIGLVDFPSMINGEEVMLCWKSDEENIQYYHSLEDGFAGRKPIPEEYLIS